MTAIALHDQDARLSGFLLLAGDGELKPNEERDGMFAVLPEQSDDLDTQESRLLQDLRDSEWPVQVTSQGDQLYLKIDTPVVEIHIQLTPEGSGHWTGVTDGNDKIEGICALA